MLYVILVPVGAVTVIVPVATLQVGCVSVACGVAGLPGTASMIKLADTVEVHPSALVTV